MLSQDSIYARRPWNSLREQQLADSLSEWTDTPADAIRNLAPPIPNIGLTPPRFGYVRRVLDIQDIARLDDIYPSPCTDYSRPQSGYSATQTPSLGGY